MIMPIDFAKAYLKFGWSLIPILPETKTPPIKWGEYQERKATLEEITEWIKKGYYLAVVTGAISGILVVDDDRVKHNLNEWGFDAPVIAKTQSGGKHYYFKYDREIHSHSNTTLHIDLKAWHSYCLLPPFNNREWVKKPSQNLSKLQPIPDEIVRLINSDKLEHEVKHEALNMSDFLNIPDGSRTESLHRIACSIFNKMDKPDGVRVLMGVNATYQPPLTQKEFDYQVSRAWDFVSENKIIVPQVEQVPTVGQINRPKSLTEIAQIRLEQRKLEKVAPSTGYPELDRLIKGFVPGHLYTMTGETNIGKTAMCCNFSHQVSEAGGKVLYFALEPESNVVEYLASCRLDKRFSELTDEDICYDNGNIKVYTDINTTEELANILEGEARYDLVIIDHIGYFIHTTGNVTQEQSNVVKRLAKIAAKNRCAILEVVHPNKPGTQNRVLTKESISGSYAFSQDSDEILILERMKESDDPRAKYINEGFIVVEKTKCGPNGAAKIIFSSYKAIIKSEGELFNTSFLSSSDPNNGGNKQGSLEPEKEPESSGCSNCLFLDIKPNICYFCKKVWRVQEKKSWVGGPPF